MGSFSVPLGVLVFKYFNASNKFLSNEHYRQHLFFYLYMASIETWLLDIKYKTSRIMVSLISKRKEP